MSILDDALGYDDDDITPPIADSNVLPIQIAVYVPSTKNGEQLSESGFRSRVESERKWMDQTWGGDTTIEASGGYTGEKGLVTEEVVIVESSTSVEEYRRNREKFADHIKKRRKTWGQEQLGFEIEGRFYMYPAKDFAPKADIRDQIDVV